MDILALVASMSSAEKQAFKKLFPHESEFVRLYDYINRNKNYNTDKIKVYLAKRSGKEITRYTSGYLSVIKNYLKEKILECLRLQLIHKRPSYEIMVRALNSEILLEKGLFNMANNELEKAKKIGKSALFPIEQLTILRKQSIFHYYQNYQTVTFDDLLLYYDRRQMVAEDIKIESSLARILSIIGYCSTNHLSPTPYIEAFKQTKLFQSETLQDTLNFENRYLLFWVKSLLAEIEGQSKKAIAYFDKAIQVWVDTPDLIATYPRMYLGACAAYFKLIEKFSKEQEIILKRQHFSSLIQRVQKVTLTEDEKHRYNAIFLLFQLYSFKSDGLFHLIEAAIAKVEEVFTYSDILTKYMEASFRYYVAFGLFKLGKYEEALDWITPVFNNEIAVTKYKVANLIGYIILYLLIHFQLGNYRFLSYESKKKINLLKKLNQWEAAPTSFFKDFQRVIKLPYDKTEHEENLALLQQYLT